jgi:Ulp1 family protease
VPEVKRLLDGLWVNNNIIDAYLVLCSFSCPDIKFLSTQWFSGLEYWGKKASNRTTSWVSLSFHTSDSPLMRNIPKISKQASDVYAAMNMFTAVITVINYPTNHWITLRFDPRNLILEVFDSLAPKDFSHRKQKFEQVGSSCGPWV